MKIYPFDLDIDEVMTFRDNKNNVKAIVGKEDDWKEKNNFYKFLVENNIKCELNKINEKYIRYYPILPKKTEEAYKIAEGEGYTFCKPSRGAFKVYVWKVE